MPVSCVSQCQTPPGGQPEEDRVCVLLGDAVFASGRRNGDGEACRGSAGGPPRATGRPMASAAARRGEYGPSRLLDSPVIEAILADVDGDGLCEIVVHTDDGTVRVLK